MIDQQRYSACDPGRAIHRQRSNKNRHAIDSRLRSEWNRNEFVIEEFGAAGGRNYGCCDAWRGLNCLKRNKMRFEEEELDPQRLCSLWEWMRILIVRMSLSKYIYIYIRFRTTYTLYGRHRLFTPGNCVSLQRYFELFLHCVDFSGSMEQHNCKMTYTIDFIKMRTKMFLYVIMWLLRGQFLIDGACLLVEVIFAEDLSICISDAKS